MVATAPLEPGAKDFQVPAELKARVPPEARGLRRDEARMLVVFRGSRRIEHARLRDLTAYLEPPDLIVINTSSTLPAALPVTTSDNSAAVLHLSTHLPGDVWAVELRDTSGSPWDHGPPGD